MEGTNHVGREVTFSALGREWKLGRWTRGVWRDWLAWAKTILPNPLEEAARIMDAVVAKDAAIYRDLLAADEAENAKAKAEKRQPRLVSHLYQPTSEQLLRAALDKSSSYLSIASPEAKSLLTSPVGSAKLFALLLAKHHPAEAADEATVEDLMDELGEADAWRLMNKCQGRGGEAKNESGAPAGDQSPKGSAAGA